MKYKLRLFSIITFFVFDSDKGFSVLQIKERAKGNAEQFCDKYGNFRMPFLWTGIHLIDVISEAAGVESGSQAEKEQTLNREVNTRRVIRYHFYDLWHLRGAVCIL